MLMQLYALKGAAFIALKNAGETFLFSPLFAITISVAAITEFLGAYGIAFVAALVGSLFRWWHFKLETKDGIKGLVIAPVMAVVLARTKLPLFETFLGELSAESMPMINGFFIGLFGLMIVGFAQDLMRSYVAKKGKQ